MRPRLTRRELLKSTAAASLVQVLPGCAGWIGTPEPGTIVNDIQSELNRTAVSGIFSPATAEQLQQFVWSHARAGTSFAVCGGRHSMGGQQFLKNAPLLDTNALSSIYELDTVKGLVRAGAGIQWPELFEGLLERQADQPSPWVVREKQTGVDRVSLGGSISSNVHGRGLNFPPFISDIESMRIIDANGEMLEVSRNENSDLFALVCGGYGLFGVVADVTLRLVRRHKVMRRVKVIPLAELLSEISQRRSEGYTYGDCQYAIDLDRAPELHPGVLSCYRPVADDVPIPAEQLGMTAQAWGVMYELARTDKPQAFRRYSEYYLKTDGQVYWSDAHQLAGDFFRGYVSARKDLGGTEMISEFYVTEERLFDYLKASQLLLRQRNADITFGTIRFIKRDFESFLAWAREDLVCIVCNLHVDHTPAGIKKVADDFRALIDLVMKYNGRYYLTYHRYARPDQVLAAYPMFPEFLRLKREKDPQELFQSDWYRHYVR